MAKTRKHSATFDGCTFTRGSQSRIYTHAVLIRYSTAEERVKCEADARRSFHTNLDYHQQYAAGTSEFLRRNSWETEAQHLERTTKNVAEARAWLALGVEGHVAAALARFDANIVKHPYPTSDGAGFYSCAGWCGRLDLAQKLASSCNGIIVTAEVQS